MRWFRRLATAALIILLLPVAGPLVSTAVASATGCQVNEGGVYPCVVMGIDIGEPLAFAFVAGWLALMTLPLAALVGLLWIVIEIIWWLRSRNQNG